MVIVLPTKGEGPTPAGNPDADALIALPAKSICMFAIGVLSQTV